MSQDRSLEQGRVLQRAIDDYCARLRRSMRGASSDVMQEVEAEIRAHVEDALAAADSPDLSATEEALRRLGAPEDYGREMALYMMVDRGYRDWSLPHMLRSAAYWAISTVGGAFVVLLFGSLFAAAGAMLAAGLGAALFSERLAELQAASSFTDGLVAMPAWPPLLLAGLGLVGLVALTLTVRWLVGQYVLRSSPQPGLAEDAGSSWARRAERRILGLAGIGVLLIVLGTSALALALPLALTLLGPLGLALLAAAPVLGVLWSRDPQED